MIDLDLLFWYLKGRGHGNRFWAKMGQKSLPPALICNLFLCTCIWQMKWLNLWEYCAHRTARAVATYDNAFVSNIWRNRFALRLIRCSFYPKRHLGRVGRICRAHGRDQQTDRRTDGHMTTLPVPIGRFAASIIPSSHSCLLCLHWMSGVV